MAEFRRIDNFASMLVEICVMLVYIGVGYYVKL